MYLDTPSPSPHRSKGHANRSPRSAHRRRSSSRLETTPHDVADEEPPHAPFHEPEFQQAFADAKKLVGDLASVLASSSLHREADSRIRALYQQAIDLSHFQSPIARTVGLVGDSGVGMSSVMAVERVVSYRLTGKSSLLNSLLDLDGFARSVRGKTPSYLGWFTANPIVIYKRATVERRAPVSQPSITTTNAMTTPSR